MDPYIIVGISRLKNNVITLIATSMGVWGILVQNVAYAVVMPIWCFIYLSTSRVVSSRRLSDFLVNVPNLAGIAISMVLGYALPTILMALPAPSIIDHDLKQSLMSSWQVFPAWVSIIQGVMSYLLPQLGEASEARSTQKLKWMRVLYASLLITAGIGQASTITLMATSKFFPGLFAPEFVGVFNPSSVFLPAATSPSTKMPSIGAGTLLLLQYDHYIGSTAMALWSTVLFANTYRSGTNKQSIVLMIIEGVVMLALTGPLGYATACVWARDELIIADDEVDGKKVQ